MIGRKRGPALPDSEDKLYCVCPITRVPKKKRQLSFNNRFEICYENCDPPKFKNEDINTAIDVIKPTDYIVTAGLNGFFHVPIHQNINIFRTEMSRQVL